MQQPHIAPDEYLMHLLTRNPALAQATQPILQQQAMMRSGRPVPGGLTPGGVQAPMYLGTGGPAAGNPNSMASIASALAQGQR